MNILYITDMYNIGGGERNLIDLAQEVKSDKSNKVIIILPKEGQLSAELLKKGIDYIVHDYNHLLRREWIKGLPIMIDIYYTAKVIKKIEDLKIKYDVIHCNSLHSIPFGKILAKHLNIPIVWTCHGYWEKPRGLRAKWMEKNLDAVVAITPEIFEMVQVTQKALIPLGVSYPDEIFEKNISNNVNNNRILCVGRFQFIKGQDLMIRALKLIHERIPSIEVHFFGGFIDKNPNDYNFRKSLLALVSELGLQNHVCFHDFDAAICKQFNSYDLLVIPSRYESFSITLLEAMINGIAVVAPNIGGPQYILENEEKYLFMAGDIQDLADKCTAILAGDIKWDQKKMIERAKCFSIANQANKLLALYRGL